jgi:hypothetical protein
MPVFFAGDDGTGKDDTGDGQEREEWVLFHIW